MDSAAASARFEQLFRAYYGSVFSYALRRAPSSAADDAVAETFLIAWKRLESIPRQELPWLLGVTRRVLANQRRRDATQERVTLLCAAEPVADEIRDATLDPELDIAFSQLDEREQELLKLVAWDGLLIAVVVFFGGGIYATFAYWTLGLVLHAAASPFRGTRSYRQARHLLAYAAAPVALSFFVVWPVRLAVYGEDVFRSGGSDRGAGNWAFVLLELAFLAWALALLVLGLRLARSNASSSSAGIS